MKKLSALLAGTIMLLAAVPLFSSTETQSITVTGTVMDDDGYEVIGCTVMVKGTTNGTITDYNGQYKITAKIGDVLVFSYLGYDTQEQTVRGTVLNVTMTNSSQMLDEMVVVGYGTQGRVAGVRARESRKSRRSQAVAAPAAPAAVYGSRASSVSIVVNDAAYHNSYYPGGEEYESFSENKFIPVSKDPLSTFSLDVDGASYSNIRRMINQGQKPDADAIRVEEFVNYFSYDYGQPTGEHPVKINYEVGQCPWNTNHKLVSIGIKAKEIPSADLPPTNFVFLIDVSGSMQGRIELVKSSFKLLVNNLRPEDKVAIVVYASEVGIKLPATSGSDKQKINEAIDALVAWGSTNGGKGIQTAYKVARENFMENGNNRIILATDGDFNVGVSSPAELEKLIEKERKSGIFLTVLGYGMGNYKDNRIQTLAEKGNGNHAYIDNMQEAHKVLVQEFGGTMHTVAKDVKLQVEFNPSQVQSYRLVGYESRLLEHEDFNNDAIDAAELGVGHTVTAMYEIVPVGVESNVAGTIDPLKYQPGETAVPSAKAGNYANELLTVKLRYKDPDGDKSKLLEVPVKENAREASEDFHFASAVAMFGQLLRDSDFKGYATYDLVVSTARKGISNDEHGYRREFIRLAEAAKGLN